MNAISLGDRMKNQYENRTRYFLPRRTYTICRIDGKAFHSFTKQLNRPFDENFINVMNYTAAALCNEMAGAKFGYVQSDEISILLTDFESPATEAYFDGNIQKIASISASIASAHFNKVWCINHNIAYFDSRVFTIPDYVEVDNYFRWRQEDATRNAIQMAGAAYFSPKALHKVNCNQIQEKLWKEKQINFNDYPAGFKRGRMIVKKDQIWQVEEPPIFTKDVEYLKNLIPIVWS
jgi:tRNA(His) 5'-end guanylyltransferase